MKTSDKVDLLLDTVKYHGTRGDFSINTQDIDGLSVLVCDRIHSFGHEIVSLYNTMTLGPVRQDIEIRLDDKRIRFYTVFSKPEVLVLYIY